MSPNAAIGSTVKSTVRIALCTALILPLYACTSFSGGPIEGQLVDAESGKPLTNAVVFAVWQGTRTTMRTHEYCIFAESVRAGVDGRFKLPAWSKADPNALLTSDIEQYVYVYAPGYSLTVFPEKHVDQLRVSHFAGTVDQRLQQLRIGPCVPLDERHRVALVYRMMADEMEGLATSREQREQARIAREISEIARTNPAKPTQLDDFGFSVNVNPNDQYPEE